MAKVDTDHNEVHRGRQGRFYNNNRWKVIIDGHTFTKEADVEKFLNCESKCKE